jgi:RNA-binding protein
LKRRQASGLRRQAGNENSSPEARGPRPEADRALSERQRKHLRRLAHALKPIVTLGMAGLTEAVVAEFERALHDHELVKVRVRAESREVRDRSLEELVERTHCALVQRIGNVATLYRPDPLLPRILLPDA